ncbi:MAG TPA: hypothetical protein VMV80_05570 [Anaerolineales bacterium]|nr:hypothetical protein [Anaerolineales bacterium]
MTDTGHKFNPDSPVIYQITVQGYLDERRADWFDEMSIVPQVGAEGVSITQLTGEVVDQAALLGLLRKLYDLGLHLLSVKRIEPEKPDVEDIQQ